MIKINLLDNRAKAQYRCGDLRIKIVETAEELREVKWIRMKVFQQEQKIKKEQDFDGRDAEAVHIVAYINEMPVGTTRIRRLYDGSTKIERMAVLQEFRRRGIGSQIIKYALDVLKDKHIKTVRLSSQEKVKDFYKQFGFKEVGNVFDEANIRHIMMEKGL